jgi:beta-mannanase
VTVLAALLSGTGSALVAGAPAVATTGSALKLSANDDSYTSSGRRTANFGTADKLVIGRLDGDTKISYLKFVVPAGASVTGARLHLTAVGAAAGTIIVNRVLTNAWTESKLTSATAPALGLVVASARPRRGVAGLSFDLSAEVTGPGAYSFAVRSSARNAYTRIRSAEAGAGRPELVVTTRGPVAQHGPGTTEPATPAATTPPPATSSSGECVTGALLVPTCGVLWGAAAGGFTSAPREVEEKRWEAVSGRTATIFHTYHKGNERFPTESEIAMTRDPAHPRVLLTNWKISLGSTWARVAAGQQDRRIDAFAARAKAYGKKFFLVLNHEPENDVIARPGSGMQAKDFAAMYRHTILRLRARGVTNVINVMAYMGNELWMSKSWWKDLYPGDDVVDWMGLDSYLNAQRDDYHYGVFGDLLDRAGSNGQGFYDWATTRHAGKPMMVVEWGVYHRVGRVLDKSAAYNSVLPELKKRPAIKALVYFDTKRDDQGDRDISINSSRRSLAAFRTLAANPIFDVKLG